MTGEAPFQFDAFDSGRLVVNREFRPLLEACGLTTFAALFDLAGGEVVRAIGKRTTARIALPSGQNTEVFFLKRHQPAGVVERLKPILHLSRPILGARTEWEAILHYHAAGIPTMTPVAFGQNRSRSLVMTRDLKTDCTLLDWANHAADTQKRVRQDAAHHALAERRAIIAHVARIARRMHDCGLHHQDFYLNHLLCRGRPAELDIRVIDLGRARRRWPLSRRWIIKDLAQLDFSARKLSCSDRLRFLRLYLGRPFQPTDRWLIRQVVLKSRWIAGHTAKNNL
jgi:heptose I phosphotransferase